MHEGKIIAYHVLRKYQGKNEKFIEKLQENPYDPALNDVNNETVDGNFWGTAAGMEIDGLRRALLELRAISVYCSVLTKDGDTAVAPTIVWYNKLCGNDVPDAERAQDLPHFNKGSNKKLKGDKQPPKTKTTKLSKTSSKTNSTNSKTTNTDETVAGNSIYKQAKAEIEKAKKWLKEHTNEWELWKKEDQVPKWTHDTHNKWKRQVISSAARIIRDNRELASADIDFATKEVIRQILNLPYHYLPTRM